MDIEITSRTWRALRAHLEDLIKVDQGHLEQGSQEPGVDDRFRGRINLARELLNLEKLPPRTDPVTYGV